MILLGNGQALAWRGIQYISNCNILCPMYSIYLGVKYLCSMFSPFVTYSVHQQYCKLFMEGQFGPALFSVGFFDPIYNIFPHCMWYTWQQMACPVGTFLNDLQSKLYLPWTGRCNWYLQSMIPILGGRYMSSIYNPVYSEQPVWSNYCKDPCTKYQHVSEYYYLPV